MSDLFPYIVLHIVISGIIYSGIQFKYFLYLYADYASEMYLANCLLTPFRFIFGFLLLPIYTIAFPVNFLMKSPYVYYAGWGFHGIRTARRVQKDARNGKYKHFAFDPNNEFSTK